MRAYVPAARRLLSVPGLITSTDSTTYNHSISMQSRDYMTPEGGG
jgi:hypothetical protein